MSAVAVSLVPVPMVDEVWPKVAAGIESCCQRTGGDLTADYLWSQCRAGGAYLFIAHEGAEIIAASVFRFETWTSGKKLRCLALYGTRMRDWLPQGMNRISDLMRVGHAERLVFDGRAGWLRAIRGASLLRQTYEVAL